MKKFLRGYGSVVIFLVALAVALTARVVGLESSWTLPLIIAAVVLVALGIALEVRIDLFDAYQLFPNARHLRIDDSCKTILKIKRDETLVGIEMVLGKKLYLYEIEGKSDYIVTDGVVENILETSGGNLCVTRQNSGYQVSWADGVWELV